MTMKIRYQSYNGCFADQRMRTWEWGIPIWSSIPRMSLVYCRLRSQLFWNLLMKLFSHSLLRLYLPRYIIILQLFCLDCLWALVASRCYHIVPMEDVDNRRKGDTKSHPLNQCLLIYLRQMSC